MPNIPCPFSVSDCDCLDFPISNYTSDALDQPVFIGSANSPPVNGTWFAPGCQRECESVISQEDADLCAARAAIECSFDGAPRLHNPVPRGVHPPERFGNTVQECAADCGDGNTTTVIEPAGTVVSATQADADARAHGLACKRAAELLVCFVTTSPIDQGNVDAFVSVPIIATGGNGDYLFTLESGSLPTGITLDEVGLLSGTPSAAGTFNFELRVDDTAGGTAVRAFTWVIAAACGVTTDLCTAPGACRVRVKSFNAADWTLPWDGNLPTFGTPTPPFSPCGGFQDDTGFAGLNYSVSGGKWVFSILCPDDFTTYLANGPVGPQSTSPIGTYIKDAGSDPTCLGPASFDIEVYSP